MTIVLFIALILLSLVLVVAVLMQQGQRQGLGAIAGGADTFLGKGKAKGIDAKLAKITKIAAVVFIILAIITTVVVSKQANEKLAEQEAALAELNAQMEAMTANLSEEELAALEAGEAHLHEDGSLHYGEHTEEAAAEETVVEETASEEPAADEAAVEETAEEAADAE